MASLFQVEEEVYKLKHIPLALLRREKGILILFNTPSLILYYLFCFRRMFVHPHKKEDYFW